MKRQKTTVLTFTLCAAALLLSPSANIASARELKAHGVFSSNMVIQRNKPIVIWGWAHPGRNVTARFGDEKAEAKVENESERWEVTFPAQYADVNPRKLTIKCGDETIELDNIVIGDVWVMNGQSNMAWGLARTLESDMESAQAHLPLFRQLRINPNEHYEVPADLTEAALPNKGWVAASPDTAGGFSAIGYAFGSRLQRALQVPIGIIDNARGGASIESLVPRNKLDDHPIAKRYAESVEKRRAEFAWDAAVQQLIDKWEKNVGRPTTMPHFNPDRIGRSGACHVQSP